MSYYTYTKCIAQAVMLATEAGQPDAWRHYLGYLDSYFADYCMRD